MVQLIGRITRDATIYETTSGKKVTNFTIALNDFYKTKDGERKQFVTYINCAYWLNAGARQWQDIGSAKAAGNSSVTNHYSLTDEQPLSGINYYRLKTMDISGEFALSEIRRLDFRSSDQQTIGVYPNPARNKTSLVFEKAPQTSIAVKIYNGVGQIVRTHTFNGGQYVYDLDVKGMAQGLFT